MIDMNLNNNPRIEIRRNARWLLRLTAFSNSTDAPPGVGTYRRILSRFMIVSIILAVCFFDNSYALETPNPVILELRSDFRKIGLIGFHSIKIYKNGNVHYQDNIIIRDNDESYKTDGVVAGYDATLSKEQVDEVVKDFLSLPFRELLKYDGKRAIGVGMSKSAHLTLEDTKIDIANAFYYRGLLTILKKYMANDLKNWLCFSEKHQNSEEDCPQYLPDDFKF
ncbi:hypothetical protein ACQE3E_23935 (plasmid) [Methylomonas sp. MED-D]|uniref:hypothetical protein n=1 Tax=Methylomonas sp. MED-D TaxID=3418768 RepID=UPI003D092F91